MEKISYTPAQIMDAMKRNNCTTITEILDQFSFTGNGDIRGHMEEEQYDTAILMLDCAACSDSNHNLSNQMGDLLIRRIGPSTNLFGFMAAVSYSHGKSGHFPGWLRKALDADRFDSEVERVIMNLPPKQFIAMSHYVMSGKLHRLSYEFIVPFARYIRTHSLLPAGLIFSLIGTHLEVPIPYAACDMMLSMMMDMMTSGATGPRPTPTVPSGMPEELRELIATMPAELREAIFGSRGRAKVSVVAPDDMPEELRKILGHMPPNVHAVVMGTGLDDKMERTAADGLRKVFAAHGTEVPKELLDFLSGGPSPRG